MMPSSSVAGRALLALLLMIGFYLLACSIAGGLLYLPYAELVYGHRIHPKFALLCLAGAGSILWSVTPRVDRFSPPGPLLDRQVHPKLFAQLESVAQACRQTMPREVYLIGDVNAWVAQRGGLMGFFSRRVMGLGLPLMQALTLSEFRAVLAHEFGHYHGGDTALGPWVYKTRSAIGRTLSNLSGSLLQAPFLWYAKLFLRVSHAVSRRQEFSADALAARVVGSQPLVAGLEKLRGVKMAYDLYWQQELQPLLEAGFIAPIADGFGQFVRDQRTVRAMSSVLERELREGTTDPYDTHPALVDRIAAVKGLPSGPVAMDEPGAISLLSNVTELEQRWLGFIVDTAEVEKLRRVEWNEVTTTVLLPLWRNEVMRNASVLGDATVADLPAIVAESAALEVNLPQFGNVGEELEKRVRFVRWVAGIGLLLALQRDGWLLESVPGAPACARKGEITWVPSEIVQRLADGSINVADWHTMLHRHGVNSESLLKTT